MLGFVCGSTIRLTSIDEFKKPKASGHSCNKTREKELKKGTLYIESLLGEGRYKASIKINIINIIIIIVV